jgi:hypothetical protein
VGFAISHIPLLVLGTFLGRSTVIRSKWLQPGKKTIILLSNQHLSSTLHHREEKEKGVGVDKKWQLTLRRSADQLGCRFYDLSTVVTLSTMIPLIIDVPLVALDSTSRWNRGASVESLVKSRMVTESVPSKWLPWSITAGRGFPA